MAYNLDKQDLVKLKLGENLVKVLFCRPGPGEIIEALVKKMPMGDEAQDAQKILMANLELGRTCITGIGEGELVIDGQPLDTNQQSQGYRRDWKEIIQELCPLILIALGQYLSQVPSFIEESGLKKP